MKTSRKRKQPVSRRRVTICLPPDVDVALRGEARSSPNGELTPIILRYVRQGMSPELHPVVSNDLLAGVLMLGAALDLVREAGVGDIEKLDTACQIYGLLLEKVIYIEGVSE